MASGVHQLGGHTSSRVIGESADGIGAVGIPDFARSFVCGIATDELPDSDEPVTDSGSFRLG
jgi:hypothetical protein